MRPTMTTAIVAILLTIAAGGTAPGQRPAAGGPAWIARANDAAQILLSVEARYRPEAASRQGVPGFDDQITQLPPDRRTRMKADYTKALGELRRRLNTEKDPLVAQDLQILIKAAQDLLRAEGLADKYRLPYF